MLFGDEDMRMRCLVESLISFVTLQLVEWWGSKKSQAGTTEWMPVNAMKATKYTQSWTQQNPLII
jgi:hypothetical protein